mmetsp:Transcript_17977/g.60306  ORF Transcript_17977/g.60306 Transcript_17977/m.60306 type:complete len:243 (-) Transcript_17977:1246-1974(-)
MRRSASASASRTRTWSAVSGGFESRPIPSGPGAVAAAVPPSAVPPSGDASESGSQTMSAISPRERPAAAPCWRSAVPTRKVRIDPSETPLSRREASSAASASASMRAMCSCTAGSRGARACGQWRHSRLGTTERREVGRQKPWSIGTSRISAPRGTSAEAGAPSDAPSDGAESGVKGAAEPNAPAGAAAPQGEGARGLAGRAATGDGKTIERCAAVSPRESAGMGSWLGTGGRPAGEAAGGR